MNLLRSPTSFLNGPQMEQEIVQLKKDLILSREQGRTGREEFDGMTKTIQKLEAEVCFCLRDTPYYFG